MKTYGQKNVLIDKNIQLVAVSHGYQPDYPVGSRQSRLQTKKYSWQPIAMAWFTFFAKALNFISPSGKKFYRTNIESRVPYLYFIQTWPCSCCPSSQNAIIFYTCICQSQVRQNFTEVIIEQNLNFNTQFTHASRYPGA